MSAKRELVQILEDIALFLELKNENVFKIRAYQVAAHTLQQLDGELAELQSSGQLESVKGIGKTMALHIREFVSTGSVPYYQELKAEVAPVLLDLIKIPGLGPKKARLLYESLAIHSVGELEYACRENRLVSLPGFGIKTQDKILQGIESRKQFQGRFLLSEALPAAEKVKSYLALVPAVEKIDIAGSIRRRVETVKDIDIVIASQQPEAVMTAVVEMPGVQQVLLHGKTKTTVVLTNGIQIDVRVVASNEYGYALHHLTGSKEHHIKLRGLAKSRGMKLNEYGDGLAAGDSRQSVDETEIYAAVGLDYVAPELREGGEEIEAAAEHRLPALVEPGDLRGAFHAHTFYSDGSAGIPAMMVAAQKLGWSYLGITDHSQSAVYASGLKLGDILAQQQEIAKLNAENPGFRIFAGIESDILPDGSLDYSDDILAQFDFVIASVHSAFNQSQADMTRRIITAMDNPYVTMLGHPTGRILLAREAYAIDLEAVITAAAASGTILEINSNPYRLDLDWRWCRYAQAQGALFSINPDAHGISELSYTRYGLSVARKGWLTANDIINTRSVDDVAILLQRKRNQL